MPGASTEGHLHAQARVGPREQRPVYKSKCPCFLVMCRESSAGGGKNAGKRVYADGVVSVRELAACMEQASETVGVPGALVFGQRKVGEVIWEEAGELRVLMWPVTRQGWPFISDTKPRVVHQDDGLCERWGLEHVHVVMCEHVPLGDESRGAHALRVLRGLMRERGVACAERLAGASPGYLDTCTGTLTEEAPARAVHA